MVLTKVEFKLLFITTIGIVVASAILNIHVSSSYIKRHELRWVTSTKQITEVRRDTKKRSLSCCRVILNENAGHTFTDVTLQLNRCGPVLSISNGDEESILFYSQVMNLLDIFNKTTTTRGECAKYYTQFPEQHPSEEHPFAFAMSAKRHNANYDAYEVGRGLREAQKILLSECGLKPPVFKHEISLEKKNIADGRIFEQVERSPAKRVIIIVRRPIRTLINAQELLPICADLKVNCKIIYMDEFWSKKETSDLCNVLKTFEDSLIIGVPGAEIVYTQLLGLRHILLSESSKDRMNTLLDLRHYGTARTENGEVQLATNLVKSGRKVLPAFFPEFELHFGAELMAVSGKLYDPSESTIPNKTKIILESPQCHPIEGTKMKVTGIKDYCLDRGIDIIEAKSILEKYINNGHLVLDSKV